MDRGVRSREELVKHAGAAANPPVANPMLESALRERTRAGSPRPGATPSSPRSRVSAPAASRVRCPSRVRGRVRARARGRERARGSHRQLRRDADQIQLLRLVRAPRSRCPLWRRRSPGADARLDSAGAARVGAGPSRPCSARGRRESGRAGNGRPLPLLSDSSRLYAPGKIAAWYWQASGLQSCVARSLIPAVSGVWI
jgi:hypothetical protein